MRSKERHKFRLFFSQVLTFFLIYNSERNRTAARGAVEGSPRGMQVTGLHVCMVGCSTSSWGSMLWLIMKVGRAAFIRFTAQCVPLVVVWQVQEIHEEIPLR